MCSYGRAFMVIGWWIYIYIYDTTLMLKIREDVAYNELGYEPYEQITSEKIMKDYIYIEQRKIAEDKSCMKWEKI